MKDPHRAVSVSAELLVLQRAIQGLADSLDVEKIDNPVSEEQQRQAVAMLNLIACRLRDLGRACRGTLDANAFWAPYNAPVEGSEEEDVILYQAVSPSRRGR